MAGLVITQSLIEQDVHGSPPGFFELETNQIRPVLTSTPISQIPTPKHRYASAASSLSYSSCLEVNECSVKSTTTTIGDFCFKISLTGFEIVERKTVFTVFKIRVENLTMTTSWMLARRYTDFCRLHMKLRKLFPALKFTLPPKKWFGNSDSEFLERRKLELQDYVDAVLQNTDARDCVPVSDFFCLNEERIIRDHDLLEEMVSSLKLTLREKELEVERLKTENAALKNLNESITSSIRFEFAKVRGARSSTSKSETKAGSDTGIDQAEIQFHLSESGNT